MLNKSRLELSHLHLLLIFLLYSTGVRVSLIRLSFILWASLTTSGREVFSSQRWYPYFIQSFCARLPSRSHSGSGLCPLVFASDSGFQFPQISCPSQQAEMRGAEASTHPQGSSPSFILHIKQGLKWLGGRFPLSGLGRGGGCDTSGSSLSPPPGSSPPACYMWGCFWKQKCPWLQMGTTSHAHNLSDKERQTDGWTRWPFLKLLRNWH